MNDAFLFEVKCQLMDRVHSIGNDVGAAYNPNLKCYYFI